MKNKEYQVVIGIEIHVELKTKLKLFSSSTNEFSLHPNTNISPYDIGYPGTLPVLNKKAFDLGLLLAIFFNCQIPNEIQFDRKHYFYYDLAKGLQITQHYNPLGKNGFLNLNDQKIKILQLHLEEDTAKQIIKSNHDEDILLDFNRSGVPLVEIVTSPCFFNAEQIINFIKYLQFFLINFAISDGKMENGQLRCDLNISLQKDINKLVNNKVEIKNLNSFKAIKNAIDFEINRQLDLIHHNQPILMQTRFYDDKKNETYFLRKKETILDYCYFPEPNLLPFRLKDKYISETKSSLGLFADLSNFIKKYDLRIEDLFLMNSEKFSFPNYLQFIKEFDNYKSCNKWWFNVLLHFAKQKFWKQSLVKSLGKLIDLTENKKLNALKLKQNLEALITGELSEQEFLKKNTIIDYSEADLFKIMQSIYDSDISLQEMTMKRKDKAEKFLMGQLMKQTKGKINAKDGFELVKKFLGKL